MKALVRMIIVFAVSVTLRADDLLDAVLTAQPPVPVPPSTQSVSTPAPQPSAVEALNSTPSSPKPIPPAAQPPKPELSENKADGNAEVKDTPSPARRVQVHFGPRGSTKTTTRKSNEADSAATARKRGGVMACCVGCCFGRRTALDYNDGMSISPREWAGLIPFIGIFPHIATCLDAFAGVSRSQLHDEAPAYY